MKEENKKIKLPLGQVNLDYELGIYYIDMRPAIVHYTSNFYDGKMDDKGVPMIGTKEGLQYSPINIAQYGLMLHADWLENKNIKTLEVLKNCLSILDKTKTINDDTCAWFHNYVEVRYNIAPPWASAMAQGELISFYLRMYQVLNDENLLNTAIKAYNFLKIDVKNGGVRKYDEDGNLWFEEYPSSPSSYVLNGFIYTIFGLYDLYRVSKDSIVKDDINACILTLKNNLHKFDSGYWSNYDLLKKELVRYYYQKNVHVPQLEILYILTGESIFEKYKIKWENNINPFNYFLVKVMYRIRPRIQKLKKIFNI